MADQTADDRYILKPLTNADGKRGYRLEIDEFLADNELTNLFLIALAKLQQDSLREWGQKPDWLTYYSLAGIHGYPQEKWNGYPNEGSEWGYCHHSMNTFPTWHRPYLFLFESAVHEEMARQANGYPDKEQRQTYLDAAARFRFPYWDLIMPRKDEISSDPTTVWGCPEIFKAEDVYVKFPKGDSAKDEKGFSKIRNPLASFTFPNAQEHGQHPERKQLDMNGSFNKARTARRPTSNSNNENDHSAFDLAIQQQAAGFATQLWQMLSPDQKGKSLDHENVEIMINEERSWESFANHSKPTDTIRAHKYATVSLESWHNGLHIMIGTGKDGFRGHMGTPAYAAFDPIFWMHHNNIERIFTLFQALYPSKYTNAQDSEQALYPFMTGRGRDCYASKDDLIKSYWGSGYAIPGDKKLDPTAVREKVKLYLTDTYYWATNKTPLPGSLPGWPKNLASSWALHGQDATAPVAPAQQMTAIAVKAGVPELVSRKVLLQADSPAIQEKVIEASKVIELVHAVDSSLPDGALTGTPSISQRPIQQTWNAHIRVRKFAFQGSFSIHLFIGHVKDDQPERYMTKKNEAGFTGIFASGLDSGCANCARNQEADILVEDVVPLTTILYDYLDASDGSETRIRDGEIKTIRDLEPDRVVPFLTEHLQWRMIDLGSTLLVGQERQAKLEVTVTSRQFLPPAQGNLMGVYGPYTPHPDITRTKPGGAGYTYQGP